jgi:hypothetical protein
MKDIRSLSRHGDFMGSISEAQALTREFKGTHLSGAARWVAPHKAVIQLSLRYKSNDHFWFSLFHEAGRLLERKRRDHIDVDIGGHSNQAEARVATLLDGDVARRLQSIPGVGPATAGPTYVSSIKTSREAGALGLA